MCLIIWSPLGHPACLPISPLQPPSLPLPLTHPAVPAPSLPAADGALAVLYGRLVLPASCALVAVMAGTTLWNGQRMCVRVLESPGVEEPLAALHSLLGHAL